MAGEKIRNFAHKGLKRFYTEGSLQGMPPDTADKLRKMLAYVDSLEDAEELRALTAWNVQHAGPVTAKEHGA